MTEPTTPMDTTIYLMAGQMARAVVKGFLPRSHVRPALTVAAHRAERDRRLEGPADGVIGFALHIFRLAERRYATRRLAVEYQIAMTARRMLETGVRANAIWAEAHNLNGAAGFPMSEAEVHWIVRGEAERIARARKWQARQGSRRVD